MGWEKGGYWHVNLGGDDTRHGITLPSVPQLSQKVDSIQLQFPPCAHWWDLIRVQYEREEM
jgi:hypothetical protein